MKQIYFSNFSESVRGSVDKQLLGYFFGRISVKQSRNYKLVAKINWVTVGHSEFCFSTVLDLCEWVCLVLCPRLDVRFVDLCLAIATKKSGRIGEVTKV